jgi:Spy/CpxP family protein refolding chaperone
MSLIRAIIRTGFAVIIVGTTGFAAYAQEKTPNTSINPPAGQQQPSSPRVRGREGMRGQGHRRGEKAGLQQLNLSETQRQQMHDTFTKFRESIRPQVEELRQIRQKFDQANASIQDQTRAQSLRNEIRTAREQARMQAESVLSPEQQEQVKQMREQRKLRREEMRQRRGDDKNTPAPVQ